MSLSNTISTYRQCYENNYMGINGPEFSFLPGKFYKFSIILLKSKWQKLGQYIIYIKNLILKQYIINLQYWVQLKIARQIVSQLNKVKYWFNITIKLGEISAFYVSYLICWFYIKSKLQILHEVQTTLLKKTCPFYNYFQMYKVTSKTYTFSILIFIRHSDKPHLHKKLVAI
jgi:hypothetical protein